MTPVTHHEHINAPTILRAARRGSALLIVVGTLAIIAVFAAIYIAIGQGDQRVAQSIESRNATSDSTSTIANHLADVIAIDREALVTRRASLNEDTLFAERETTDAPYTDYTMRAESNNAWELFNPQGSHDPTNTDALPDALEDYRVASDPWLASTTPTYLGDPGQPSSGTGATGDLRPFGKLIGPGAQAATNYAAGAFSSSFLDNRDWRQISNFGPDGRPVNLFNLRPNTAFGDNTLGGFDAEPGVGTTNRNGRQFRRMSEHLTLWNVRDDDPLTELIAFDPETEGIWLQGRNQPTPKGDVWATNVPADLANVPAVWTMNQRFAFLPLNQPFVTYNRQNRISSWADPDYPAYQWADADGDGMADSRWFELVAARDPAAGSSSNARDDIERYYDAGRSRVFFAARAVDLSSMVNVNTATDLLAIPEPDQGAPLGATPADIDLRRLLTMQDGAADYSLNPLGGLSPKFFHRPPSTRRRDLLDTDYFNYESRFENPGTYGTTTPVVIEPASNVLAVGRYAYDAIKRSIVESRVLDERYFALPPQTRSPNPGGAVVTPQPNDYDDDFNSDQTLDEIANAYSGDLNPATNPNLLGQKFLGTDTAVDRRDYYNSILDPGVNTNNAIYTENDLSELLTFHGLNDPSTLSRLEKAALGRMPSIFNLNQRSYSPLLSNRPLDLDRTRHGLHERQGYEDYSVIMTTTDTINRDVTGVMSKESMVFFDISPRKYLTTLSGSVPLTQGYTVYPPINGDATPNTLEAREQTLAAAEAAPALSSVINNAQTSFGVYSKALLGELDARRFPPSVTIESLFVDDLSTRRSNATAAPYATLFYGHRGPELALRIAAHSAVNMKDLADSDTTPTVATLIVDNEPRDDLEDTNSFPDDDQDADPTDPVYQDYPGRAQGNFFDLGENNLPGTPGSAHLTSPKRRAINIYGVEAMPIITEVSSFYVYHDAHESAGGDDDDFNVQRPRARNGLVPIPNQTNISIDGTPDIVGNPDLLMEVIAFQLHNPFDTEISLGGRTIPVSDNTQRDGVTIGDGDALTRHRLDDSDTMYPQVDTNANYQFDYYIEWKGYFFKLAEYSQYYPPSSNLVEADPRTSDTPILGVNNPAIDFAPSVVNDPNNGNPLDPTTYPDFVARNVVLQPGETRVFYAVANNTMSGDQWVLDDKWINSFTPYHGVPTEFQPSNDLDTDGLADGFDGRGWTGMANEWIQRQLSVINADEPVQIHPMNPQTGEYLPVQVRDYLDVASLPAHTTFNQLSAATGRRDVNEVRLWRKVVTPGEESRDTTNFNTPFAQNLLHNDMLVDRMRLDAPTTTTDANPMGVANTTGIAIAEPLDQVAGWDNSAFPGTYGYDYDYPMTVNEVNANVRNDNLGMTIVRWATAGRRDWNDTTLGDLSAPGVNGIGQQIHEWILSSRANPGAVTLSTWDNIQGVAGQADELTYHDMHDGDADDPFSGSNVLTDYETRRNLFDTFFSNPVVMPAVTRAEHKSEIGTFADYGPDNGSYPAEKFARDTTTNILIHPDALTLHGDGEPRATDLRPDLYANAAGFNNSPRLADLLLALGIGPAYAPDDSRTDNNASYYPDEWMTLTEALAIALGYENPAAATDAVESVWNDTYAPGDEALVEGRLAIDNYVAYINADTSENPPEFTYDEDLRRGTGAPMALGVIDGARPFAVAGNQNILNTPVPGTININTAPVQVLRLLPGLSPSTAEYYADSQTAVSRNFEWWGSDPANAALNLPNLTRAAPAGGTDERNRAPDVAALMQGYRDRTWVLPRARSTVLLQSILDYDISPVNYAPSDGANMTTVNTPAFGANLVNEIPQIFNGDTLDHRDRQSVSGIDALRNTPGFGSLGEILAVTFSEDAFGRFSTSGNHRQRVPNLDIQQFAYDELNIDGLSDTEIALDPQLFAGNTNGATIDDQAERLAIANGILNTITVRSDYFAVWFVMHVYQPGDVENLQPQDPLIPSVAKRFVMVVDRSNVTRPGDAPRIVLFKEVPM